MAEPWKVLSHNKQNLDALVSEYNSANEKNQIQGSTVINKGGIVEKNVTVKGYLEIGEKTTIKSGTYIEGPVKIGKGCTIGPNAYLRPYSCIGDSVKIGNSSEVKNSVLGTGCSVAHLSYIGDSVVGKNVNFGCGAITANVRMDKSEINIEIAGAEVSTGRSKFGSIIGDNVSIGIQASLMPGIVIGENSFVGSNTIVKTNVPANSIIYSLVENIIVEKKKK